MSGPRKEARGAAAEGVSFRINEGPSSAPPPAFRITYVGEGVVALPGVGVFARHVSASVGSAVAAKLDGDPAWIVERPRDDDA